MAAPSCAAPGNMVSPNRISPSFITWTCDVCHRERADHRISVERRRAFVCGAPVDLRVRYCNDTAACLKGARTLADQLLANMITPPKP